MSGKFSDIKESLVEKILEQGQRLRNAMVKSILENDPLGSLVLDNKTYNSPVSGSSLSSDKITRDDMKKLLDGYLCGDRLSKKQEEIALETMPFSDLCVAPSSKRKCACATCDAYYGHSLKCDLRRPKLQEQQPINRVVKQADSLKVVLQSIHLNEFGSKKVAQNSNREQTSETYFVEYSVPEIIVQSAPKSKSKTDTGLQSNHVRVCARRTSNVIYIKQTFVHAICNLYNCNLADHDLIFFIKYKTTSQKKSELLGIAKFNFGTFENTETASCGKTLPIYLNEESTIIVGSLKVTIQLGAGKLYFGQEFVDAVSSRKTSVDSSSSSEDNITVENKDPIAVRPAVKKSVVKQPEGPTHLAQSDEVKCGTDRTVVRVTENSFKTPTADVLTTKPETELLFGFIYISEAHFLNISPSSYLSCQPYGQSDTSFSRIIYNNSNPLYNFCQTIPLLYEESLLLKLRENFSVIEFWKKTGQVDELLGVTRLPLHQFYLGYRNDTILKHLKKNKLPLIGTDWWEPIYSLEDNELIGQVQTLTALGTEEQINNLQAERGFKNDIVKAKFSKFVKSQTAESSGYFNNPLKAGRNSKVVKKSLKVDVAVQSDMEPIDNGKSGAERDMMPYILKLLEQQQRSIPQRVENATNTEKTSNVDSSTQVPKTPAEPHLGKTSDLLESLQKALKVDTSQQEQVKPRMSANCFRAQICINEANQLPSRRKSKSKGKNSKNGRGKQEENLMPSTYVTFQTMSREVPRITPIYPRSTTPKWNYKCEVPLPKDLLTNNAKRLLFKVWKKSANTVLQPNLDSDLVLGFASLDLTVLAAGLPNVQGWFNIIDFSGKCNGQINIHINPLEKIKQSENDALSNTILPINDSCNEVLGRALKRKFTELDEITQRLRFRLSEVISDDPEPNVEGNDEIAEEFERDINSLCVEEDFDLIDFEQQAKKFSDSHTSKRTLTESESVSENLSSESSGLLMERMQSKLLPRTLEESFCDKELAEGKQRIDALLGKLSLLTAEGSQPLANRYVSGCSTASNDIQEIFKDLDDQSRPNITAGSSFDPTVFQQLYETSSSKNSSPDRTDDTSVISNFSSDCRPHPDGAN